MVHLGDSHKVQILNEETDNIIVALVVAIDCVKADQAEAFSAAVTLKWKTTHPIILIR